MASVKIHTLHHPVNWSHTAHVLFKCVKFNYDAIQGHEVADYPGHECVRLSITIIALLAA